MKICLRAFSLFLICTITFTACKKEKNAPAELLPLVGSWTETPISPDFQRKLFFSADGTFTMHFTYYGLQGGVTSTGTYSVSGNKLTAIIKSQVLIEPKKQPEIRAVDQSIFDSGTFSITGNVLTVNFLSYPADGPVPTTIKFLKN